QRDQGPLGVEKPHRVAHHLLDDPVELQRTRQDERQLLEGKELRQTAVELVRSPPAVALALAQAAPEPQGPAYGPHGGDGEECEQDAHDAQQYRGGGRRARGRTDPADSAPWRARRAAARAL